MPNAGGGQVQRNVVIKVIHFLQAALKFSLKGSPGSRATTSVKFPKAEGGYLRNRDTIPNLKAFGMQVGCFSTPWQNSTLEVQGIILAGEEYLTQTIYPTPTPFLPPFNLLTDGRVALKISSLDATILSYVPEKAEVVGSVQPNHFQVQSFLLTENYRDGKQKASPISLQLPLFQLIKF